MTDTTLTDMAPFFQRYDHRNRLLFVATLSASLVLSAVMFAHGPLAGGRMGAKAAAIMWGFGILFCPLFTVGWWSFAEVMARTRRKGSPPDGSLPANAHDAHNGVRIANAGFVYNLALMASGLGAQVVVILTAYGYAVGDWLPRVTTVAVGAGSIYLGNLWPRMPTPRTPEPKAAKHMKAYRFGGWLMVIVGLMTVLLGLFLPLLERHHP